MLATFFAPFHKRQKQPWMGLSVFAGFIIGAILVFPGLLQSKQFRDAVSDFALVLVIAAFGLAVSRIAGTHISTKDAISSGLGDAVPESSIGLNEVAVPRNATERVIHLGSSLNDRPLFVTLVHGTFQPQAEWVSADSEFSKDLLRYIPGRVRIEPFRWPGQNSHEARMRAADELRAHLKRLRKAFPDAEHICIGHSHGGSIIHSALADSSFEESLLGYAFLSTPFLNFQPRQPQQVGAEEYLFLLLLLLCVVIPGYAVSLWNGWSLFGWGPSILTSALMIPFAFSFRTYRSRAARWRSAAEDFLQNLPKPCCRSNKALFIRTPGDRPRE